MIKKLTRFVRYRAKLFRRKLKQQLYRLLVDIHEGEIRISLFHIVCTLFFLFLCVGCLFRTDFKKENVTTESVLGSELTHALRHTANTRRTEASADVTLFLLPDTEDGDALSSFLDAPLYGFYLTGKEVSYLPEYYASLSESFVAGTPYIGGLSFSYNPKRLIYNRATDIMLLTKEGTYSPLSEDTLYYVVGTDTVFSMFSYLSERTFHLISIQPKDASGTPISDYSCGLLRGSDGIRTVSDVYGSYLTQNTSSTPLQSASEVFLCTSINTLVLYSELNIAGYFLVGCAVLFVTLAAIVRPHLHRTMIWFRLFLFHQKKRGKLSIRGRIYAARTARQRAA
ncbi:MAG: hypothetical protein IKT67_08470 [Lachnospiraceae bacterium]|nr:hypothetical protein [Lachnospiraceae bacterium]